MGYLLIENFTCTWKDLRITEPGGVGGEKENWVWIRDATYMNHKKHYIKSKRPVTKNVYNPFMWNIQNRKLSR